MYLFLFAWLCAWPNCRLECISWRPNNGCCMSVCMILFGCYECCFVWERRPRRCDTVSVCLSTGLSDAGEHRKHTLYLWHPHVRNRRRVFCEDSRRNCEEDQKMLFQRSFGVCAVYDVRAKVSLSPCDFSTGQAWKCANYSGRPSAAHICSFAFDGMNFSHSRSTALESAVVQTNSKFACQNMFKNCITKLRFHWDRNKSAISQRTLPKVVSPKITILANEIFRRIIPSECLTFKCSVVAFWRKAVNCILRSTCKSGLTASNFIQVKICQSIISKWLLMSDECSAGNGA